MTLSLALAVALAGSPAGARETAGESGWGLVRREAFDRLDAAASLLSGGGPADAVEAASGLVDITPTAVAGQPGPVPGSPGGPIGSLLSSVLRAGELSGAAVRVPSAKLQRLSARGDALQESDVNEAAALRTSLEASVDRSLLYGAALAVASEIERSLTEMRPSLAADATVVGCDRIDQPPVLCVGGEGANTYARDYALQVDLGGDDTYANSAGAADPLGNGLAASVVLDLGGNDRYASPVPSATGAGAVQGAADVGGIGMLVDASGNDVYEATATEGTAGGQGMGAAGVGLLADLAGNDTYRVVNESPADVTGASETARGQGNGVLGGMGILLDRTGDDSFLLRSHPAPAVDPGGTVRPGDVSVEGSGFANVGGTAILAVGDGADEVALEAVTRVAPDEGRPVAQETVTARGMGYANNGSGALIVGGAGPTTYRTTVENTTPQSYTLDLSGAIAAQYLGHASAQLGGLAAIQDAGGNDQYLAEVTGAVVRRVTVGDGCGCGQARFKAVSATTQAFAVARGSGGATGAIRDLGGDDRYTSQVTSLADIEVRDDRTAAPPPDPDTGLAGPMAIANPLNAVANGQALGALGGAGFIHDGGGNDTYESFATSEARAKASAALPQLDDHAQAEANGFTAKSLAQGAADAEGYGELRDVGGTDQYVSVNRSLATAAPNTHADGGTVLSTVQGSAELAGTASFADIDGAVYQYDSFKAIPEDPTFSGSRGEGAWVDAVTVAGGGTVPSGGSGLNA